MQKTSIIIDFDSTFLKVESLDLLASVALEGSADQQEITSKIASITDQGMNGEISFAESLAKRIALLKASKTDIERLVVQLKDLVTPSFKRNSSFIKENAADIYIVSSGFKELIVPVVALYGIDASHVYANTFTFNESDIINGVDEHNPLAGDGGKIKVAQLLNLQENVFVIGDGYTDYEIKEAGIATQFYAFTENVSREKVLNKADHITATFDEFLFVNKFPMALSYPKNRIKVLLLENVHIDAYNRFKEEGYDVELLSGALDEKELSEKIKGVHILGIRSKTNVTASVLKHADRLMAIGAFCIGTNQIDLDAALSKGVVVFNAPYSNTRSVVELAIGEIVLLLRNLPDKIAAMHNGGWDKSAKNAFEVRGKKLGIIGYGNIGSQLSILAEAMGMDVHFYDIVDKLSLGNATKCNSLKELLNTSDVVSLHVDGRPSNKKFFGKEEFEMMKPGSYLLNLSRGSVVNIPDLVEVLKNGKLNGAGVDVFPEEPKTNNEPFSSELQGLSNVILTPHIGGSTAEAQEHIGSFVPTKLMNYIDNGSTFGSVNFSNLQLQAQKKAHRLIHIHKNVPGMLAQINNILSENNCNVLGQYLKTNEGVGFVITDIDQKHNEDVLSQLKAIPETIKFRILY